MTVSSSTNRVNYTGNGVTVAFSFPYITYEETDIQVYLDSVLQSSGYTVTGAGTAAVTVTFDTAPASDVAILIKRVVSQTQETDFENFDGNPSDVTEKQFDLVVMMIQELSDGVDRSVKLREDDPTVSIELPLVADRANMFLAFDSVGNPTASAGATSTGTTFGATGEDLAATATPALARAVLELGALATEDIAPLAKGGTGANYASNALLFAGIKQVATDAATGVVEFATDAELQTGTATDRAVTPANVKNSLGFADYNETTRQVITAGGTLSVAHTLGRKPILYQPFLQCVTTEHNYAVDDEVPVSWTDASGSASGIGVSCVADATNLVLRYGNAAATFIILNKTSGATESITNANWRLVIRSWA